MLGPIARNNSQNWPAPNGTVRSFHKNQSVYKSVPRDHHTPLPYLVDVGHATLVNFTRGTATPNLRFPPDSLNGKVAAYASSGASNDPSGINAVVNNRCRSKMISQLNGDATAAWAANVAERAQTFEAIERRALQIFRAAKALKHLRFGDVRRELGITGKIETVLTSRGSVFSVKGRQHQERVVRNVKANDIGGAWLEYWFGYAPLMGDIHNSIQLLSRPTQRTIWVSARAGAQAPVTKTTGTIASGLVDKVVLKYKRNVEMGLWADLINPWTSQLELHGVANPVSVAWELIPFSFLVDWFANVGDVINSYTDTLGWVFRAGYMSTVRRAEGSHVYYPYDKSYPFEAYAAWRTVMQRTQMSSLPSVELHVQRLNHLSVTRAATAVALLTKFLKTF